MDATAYNRNFCFPSFPFFFEKNLLFQYSKSCKFVFSAFRYAAISYIRKNRRCCCWTLLKDMRNLFIACTHTFRRKYTLENTILSWGNKIKGTLRKLYTCF